MIKKLLKLIKVNYLIIKTRNNDLINDVLKFPKEILLHGSRKKNEIVRSYLSDYEFNGQKCRSLVVKEIINNFKPTELIETGTYLGNTLEFLSKFGIKTHSIEINPEFYFISKSRFVDNNNVILYCDDSLKVLPKIISKENPTFIYLDSHWYENLPLEEELEIINSINDVIVLIDDFKIPGNADWKFDKYNQIELSLEDINIPTNYSIYFREYKPNEDGGFKSGCVFLSKGEKANSVLNNIELIKKYSI